MFAGLIGQLFGTFLDSIFGKLLEYFQQKRSEATLQELGQERSMRKGEEEARIVKEAVSKETNRERTHKETTDSLRKGGF